MVNPMWRKLAIICYIAAGVSTGASVAFAHVGAGRTQAPYAYVILGAAWPLTGLVSLGCLLVPEWQP